MTRTPLKRRPPRGVTLVEAIVAMAILLVAGLALASLQISSYRSSRFGDRMLEADALANDLAENMKLWSYDDVLLNPHATVTSTSDSSIKWNLGRDVNPSPAMDFSNADLPASYHGLPLDVDRDGTDDFQRYWQVYLVQDPTSSAEVGKLVQIFVRWRESGTGGAKNYLYRQVSAFTFLRNPGNALK